MTSGYGSKVGLNKMIVKVIKSVCLNMTYLWSKNFAPSACFNFDNITRFECLYMYNVQVQTVQLVQILVTVLKLNRIMFILSIE